MLTSLADQLRRLAVPQSLQRTEKKSRPSLLFDGREAANLDRDALYEIGLDGLRELIEVDPVFQQFSNNLFELSSRHMERTVESPEINKKLDKQIQRFLLLLSPYFLLKPAHKALEWLISRYHIQDFNIQDLMALIIPYHETNMFIRTFQLIDLRLECNTQWIWLQTLQKQGLHLPKSVLVNHALSDSSFLRFICDATRKIIKVNMKYENEHKLGTLLTFYGTTMVNILARGPVNDHQLTILLPSFLTSLSHHLVDFKAAGYMVGGQLVVSNQLTQLLIDNIINQLINNTEKNLQKEQALLLVLIFQTQNPVPCIPVELLSKLAWLTKPLSILARESVLVQPLVCQLVRTCLDHVIDGDDPIEAEVFCWSLATEIESDFHFAKELIGLINMKYNTLNAFLKLKKPKKQRDPFLLKWMKGLMEAALEKHSDVLDKNQEDSQTQRLRTKWRATDDLPIQEAAVARLIKMCHGDSHESAWLQLRPLLLNKIEQVNFFKALCKVAPSYDNLVLLLCLEKLLSSSKYSELSKQSLWSKILTSNFGSTNSHLKDISNMLLSNKNQDMADIIRTRLLKQARETENSIEFEPWLAALRELKELQTVLDNNPIWSLGLNVLAAALPLTFSATHALELLGLMESISRRKLKNRFEIVKSVITYLSKVKGTAHKWFNLENKDSEVWLKVRLLDYILFGIYKDSKFQQDYQDLLDSFSKTCFRNGQEFVRFICAVCCGIPVEFNPTEFRISPHLQLYSLHLAWMQLSKNDKEVFDSFQPELKQVTCYLIITLGNQSPAVRRAALNVLQVLVSLLNNHDSDLETILLDQLLLRNNEIAVDADQLSVGLFCLLSPGESVQATLSKDVKTALSEARKKLFDVITDDDTPLHVAAALLQLLEPVNSSEIIQQLTALGNKAIGSGELKVSKNILHYFWLRVNETTAKVLETEDVWKLAEKCMKHQKTDELSPTVSFLKCINKELYEKLSEEKQFQLIELMITTRSKCESAAVSSAIASAVRKIYLDAKTVIPVIRKMTSTVSVTQKRREVNRLSLPGAIIETNEWKHGTCLLELIQSKKKLRNCHLLLEPLFNILKFCLDQEEQSAFEYSKQLVLGCLLFTCQKLCFENEKIDESLLNIELVVQCLRASTNPQTHHHALLLLSSLAAVIPNQVMHNIMAIFTFMGSSVARLDDEHSVKIVTQVVDTIVPVLVRTFSTETSEIMTVMAEVLRVFVWTLRDIPPHRRNPLFHQLLTTLNPERSLSTFLLLLFENYVLQGDSYKTEGLSMPSSLYLGVELSLSMTPSIVLRNVLKIIQYLIRLPVEKMNPQGQETSKQKNPATLKSTSDGLFDVDKHTPKQLKHFAYTTISFLNSLLADNSFIIQVTEISKEEGDLEHVFQEAIASLLNFIPVVTKEYDKQQNRFWKAMTQQSYDLLDKLMALVSSDMLVSVISKLMSNSVGILRRKALDLLNSHLETRRDRFSADERQGLRVLLNPLMEIIRTIGEDTDQEAERTQQTALYSVKLLAKLLASTDNKLFKEILQELCKLYKLKKCKGNLLGSVVLCIAELVACLRAHSVSELPLFMPLLLKVFSQHIKDNTTDLGMLSVTVALHRIVDILPQFLSPYLDKILVRVCTASVNWPDNGDLTKKLGQIMQKIAGNVPHRVLIPSIGRSYSKLITKEKYEATAPLLSVLSQSYSASREVLKLLPDLTQFFMSALQFRSDCQSEERGVTMDAIDKVEASVVDALVPLVLKLSESSFKPLYYQLFHWASEHVDRSITFYRLSQRLAEGLKGLFVLFAGHFLQNAATLLDAINVTKTDTSYYGNSKEGEAKSILLLKNILSTLHSVFLFDSADSSNFLNKDKFEVLLHPLVDQLDNLLGGIETLEERTKTMLTPCLAQMALATDDTLWKSLNYEVLMKTKSLHPQVRIGAIETIVAIASKLGEDYLLLLPETIGSLAELLEDEDERVEKAMKSAIQRMEEVLGQPIREYFQ